MQKLLFCHRLKYEEPIYVLPIFSQNSNFCELLLAVITLLNTPMDAIAAIKGNKHFR